MTAQDARLSGETDVPASWITVKFAALGSVVFSIDTMNVIPLQLLALADYLRIVGENSLIQQEVHRQQQEEAKKLIIPKPMVKT